MALVLKDRVRETSTTTGTGTLTLAGAVAGFQSFSAIGTGNTTYYTIATSSDWEVGIGTWTSPNQLSRGTILASTNGGAAVNFGAGTKDVFVTYPAEKSVNLDANNVANTPKGLQIENASASPIHIGFDGTGNTDSLVVGIGLTGTTAGAGNFALGAFILNNPSFTGTQNICIGGYNMEPATTASQNVFIGNAAGDYLITGSNNVGIGYSALSSCTVGSDNMAIGGNALINLSDGTNNTAIGNYTLGTYSGSWNLALGTYALNYLGSSSDGSHNVAIGGNALSQLGLNGGGNNNTAIGVNALGLLDSAIGGGNNNVAIGNASGYAVDGGSNNVIIGSYTGSAAPISISGSNYVVLSDGAGNVRQTINGSGALSFNAGTSYGTSGQLLQSNGSGAAPSWGRTITSGTAAPSGGSDGDIYLQYV
jgi:hypothetical protein